MDVNVDGKVLELIAEIRNVKKEAINKEDRLRKELMAFAATIPTYEELHKICYNFSTSIEDFSLTMFIARPIWLDAHPEF